MLTKHLWHKHGGRITAIYEVGHSTHKKVAEWFYIGDIDWGEGKVSANVPIMPWAVCVDESPEARQEYDEVSGRLNAYLCDEGDWHDTKFARDGRAYAWTPNKEKNNLPLDAIVA